MKPKKSPKTFTGYIAFNHRAGWGYLMATAATAKKTSWKQLLTVYQYTEFLHQSPPFSYDINTIEAFIRSAKKEGWKVVKFKGVAKV